MAKLRSIKSLGFDGYWRMFSAHQWLAQRRLGLVTMCALTLSPRRADDLSEGALDK